MEVEEKMEVLLGQNSVMEGGEKIHSSCMEELPKEGDGQKKMDGIAGSYQFNININFLQYWQYYGCITKCYSSLIVQL